MLHSPRRSAPAALCASLTLLAVAAGAADWPQWRGPRRDGISAETAWNPRSLKPLWKAKVGEGYSGVAVVGNRAYTLGNAGGQDTVFCFNVDTGKPLWTQRYRSEGGDHPGPRCTPTVDGDRVYTLSYSAQAYCFNSASGKVLWSRDLKQELRAETPRWGFAGSALIDGNKAIYNVGAGGVALDKMTGKPLWKSGGGTAGYSSPVIFTVGKQRGVALFTAKGLLAVDESSGKPLWQYPWDTSFEVNAADPIFTGDTVFISSNYGKGCALLRVAGNRVTSVWQNRNMKNHFNTCVLLNGAYYGNDENTLRALDAKSGQAKWMQRGMGKGGLIAANGMLIALTERGELLVIKANPNSYQELSRTKVMDGTCWTPPSLANGRIYCRNHEGDLVCVDARK